MNMEPKLNTVRYLDMTYITAIPRIIYRSTISIFIDPKGVQNFVHQVLNAQDLESDDPVLGSTENTELLGGEDQKNYDIDISIVRPYYEGSVINILLELVVPAYLMPKLRLRLVFEIGTYLGYTTPLFALDSPSDGKILTNAGQPCSVGDYYHTLESHRIHQFFGDGHIFDFSPW